MKVTINEKNDYVTRMYPQISDEGQKYLKNIAQAMLLIQNPVVSPVPELTRRANTVSEGSPPDNPGKDNKEEAE
jgi:hypothetical protein